MGEQDRRVTSKDVRRSCLFVVECRDRCCDKRKGVCACSIVDGRRRYHRRPAHRPVQSADKVVRCLFPCLGPCSARKAICTGTSCLDRFHLQTPGRFSSRLRSMNGPWRGGTAICVAPPWQDADPPVCTLLYAATLQHVDCALHPFQLRSDQSCVLLGDRERLSQPNSDR